MISFLLNFWNKNFVTLQSLLSLSSDNGNTWEEDARLVRKVQKGDKDAFGKFVEKYQDSIYRYCYSILRKKMDAEDAAQNSFIKAYKKINQLKNPRMYFSWLMTIAKNECIKILRNHCGVQIVDSDDLDKHDHMSDTVLIRLIEIEELSEEEQKKIILLGVLEEIDEDDATIIRLRVFFNFSHKAIAELLNISEQNSRVRYHRALKKLAEKVKKEWEHFKNETR